MNSNKLKMVKYGKFTNNMSQTNTEESVNFPVTELTQDSGEKIVQKSAVRIPWLKKNCSLRKPQRLNRVTQNCVLENRVIREKSEKDSARVSVPFVERGVFDSQFPRFDSRNSTMNFGHVSVKTELTVKDKLLIGDPTEYKMSNTLYKASLAGQSP